MKAGSVFAREPLIQQGAHHQGGSSGHKNKGRIEVAQEFLPSTCRGRLQWFIKDVSLCMLAYEKISLLLTWDFTNFEGIIATKVSWFCDACCNDFRLFLTSELPEIVALF